MIDQPRSRCNNPAVKMSTGQRRASHENVRLPSCSESPTTQTKETAMRKASTWTVIVTAVIMAISLIALLITATVISLKIQKESTHRSSLTAGRIEGLPSRFYSGRILTDTTTGSQYLMVTSGSGIFIIKLDPVKTEK